MKQIFRAFLPPLLALILFSGVFFLPEQGEPIPPAISPELPTGYQLKGWHGTQRQESERERLILSPDTKFSKAEYVQLPRVPWEKPSLPVHVSIVFSGRDLNNSIHRPERCLPAQGHLNVRGSISEITLKDGKSLIVTRLVSSLPFETLKSKRLHYIHYYLFIGHNSICHTHLHRTLRDICDRCLFGKVQSWAYFQAGTCWSPELGISEKDADNRLRRLISELLPGQIDWKKI